MRLRSIELALPDPAAAAGFLTGVWGLAEGEVRGGAHYLRGSGTFAYIVGLERAETEFVRSVTFVCDEAELAALTARVAASGWPARAVVAGDPGGGHGVIVELPDGEVLRFLAGAGEVAALAGDDMPARLTHVVFNASDAEASGDAAEAVLGFRVSDRTRGMVFVRCNERHHSTAFSRAGFASLNHIAFEMADLDAVMRGVGRLRDHGMAPAWGPGRHGPGANAFAYYIAPFGPVIEFSTAVYEVAADHVAGRPEDWTWPAGRIDHWGLSDKDVDGLRAAEERFRFRRDWEAAKIDI